MDITVVACQVSVSLLAENDSARPCMDAHTHRWIGWTLDRSKTYCLQPMLSHKNRLVKTVSHLCSRWLSARVLLCGLVV